MFLRRKKYPWARQIKWKPLCCLIFLHIVEKIFPLITYSNHAIIASIGSLVEIVPVIKVNDIEKVFSLGDRHSHFRLFEVVRLKIHFMLQARVIS